MKTIAIIGAGLSGTLVAINLLQSAQKEALEVLLIERSGKIGEGLAYGTTSAAHLLNVRAGEMSIFPDRPDHFNEWLQHRYPLFSSPDFVPRNLYRLYLQEIFEQVKANCSAQTTVDLIPEEAIDLFIREDKAIVLLKSGKRLPCDKVVLAVGNFPPGHLNLPERSYESDPRYFQNPWAENALQHLQEKDAVLLVGTGLTMIDMVLTLYQRKHKGQIAAVSTHGWLPQIHTQTAYYPSFYEEIKRAEDLVAILQIVKKHLRHAEAMGMDWRSVIDAIRPHMQKIWFSLSFTDKKRFLRHIGHRWGLVRHRMPEDVASIIAHMQKSGQLQIKAATVTSLEPTLDGIKACFIPKRSDHRETLVAQLVLNCTGPESNIEQINSPLIHNMLAGGLLRSDPLQLGACTTPQGALITKGGTTLEQIYTLGPAMKGILWECVAVPEIRQQASNLATLLL